MLSVHQADVLKDKGVRVILMNPDWVRTKVGGEEAVLTAKNSVEGMLKVLHDRSKENGGGIYQYGGSIVPW